MTYDPNDPNRSTPTGPQPTIDPNDRKSPVEIHVDPVERSSSPLPLIIGILLALAVAYFVVQYFMTSGDAVTDDPAAVTAPAVAPDAVPAPAADNAAEAEAAAERAVDAAEDAAADAQQALEAGADAAVDAANEAADAVRDAADNVGDAIENNQAAPVEPVTPPAAN